MCPTHVLWNCTSNVSLQVVSLGENQAYLEESVAEGSVMIDLSKPKVISGPIQIVLSEQAQAILWRRASSHQMPGHSVTGNSRLHSDIQNIFSDMTDTGTSHQQWNTKEFKTVIWHA